MEETTIMPNLVVMNQSRPPKLNLTDFELMINKNQSVESIVPLPYIIVLTVGCWFILQLQG